MDESAIYRQSGEKFGFYIAASDQDLLAQISRLMSRSGYVGVMDTAGRVQYLIDGRRGPPFAARRIMDTTGRVLRDREDESVKRQLNLSAAADQVLDRHGIRPELKGFRLIRYMLLLVGLDEANLRPVSKNLYPAAAAHFRIGAGQVERDVRYALQETDLRRQGLTGAAAICRLYDEMMRLAEENRDKETFPAFKNDGEERY